MDDADAVHAACECFADEYLQRRAGLFERHAVQVDLVLDRVLAAPQFTHDWARDAWSRVYEFLPGFDLGLVWSGGQ